MKTVFILGAGASRADGGPLMYDFFDHAEWLLRAGLVNDVKSEFEDVFRAIAELQSVYAKSEFDLDNLEAVFGAIEMGRLIRKFANRSHKEVEQLRHSIVTLIVRTLEMTIAFPTDGAHTLAPDAYRQFAEILREVIDKKQRYEFSFLTFNYDVALDYALNQQRIETRYFLGDVTDEYTTDLPLLKLHGSVHWARCKQCEKIYPIDLRKVPLTKATTNNKIYLDVTKGIAGTVHPECSHVLSPPAVIVPPTWDKSSHHAELTKVWQRAAKELASAERIVVIGYSLPPSDLFFRYLFSLGTMGSTRIKKFILIDPDRDHVVLPRFQALLGPAVRGRFQHYDTDFLSSLGSLKYELMRD